MIPYVNGRIGAVISWQGVRAMARNSARAQLSLIDRRGHAIRSASLDLERLGAISGQMRAALDDTRAKAATFAKRCEPVADWRRL